MKFRLLTAGLMLTLIGYSNLAFSGYRAFLDPRSMAMGGTGVASATKFNASFHNPALIAFNRGDKPDKIYISAALATRELYNDTLEEDIEKYQNSDAEEDFRAGPTLENGNALTQLLNDINLSSYRSDDTAAFSLLVDTSPVTINFYTKRDIREMTVIRNQDKEFIDNIIQNINNAPVIRENLDVSVDSTFFELSEFGVTVATTDVVAYNMPVSWGYTAKLLEMRSSHISKYINDYDLMEPPQEQVSTGLLEWNFDIGFAMLMTDDFLQDVIGLDGWFLEGEWVFGFNWMNILPSDFTTYKPPRGANPELPGSKRAIQALYQLGLAHYRENYMLTVDLDIDDTEVFDFEGRTRFLSLGGEYFWRNDFHLRGGLRINTAETDVGAKDKAILTTGFLYQPKGFSIEGALMFNDIEVGGTVGFGLAF